MKFRLTLFFLLLSSLCFGQEANYYKEPASIYLTSRDGHQGNFDWKMCKASEITVRSEDVSIPGLNTSNWMPAIVPGTVLNSLVYNKVYPEPYYGLNNKIEKNIIPDLAQVGRDFYTYWFRTEFNLPENYKGKRIWMLVKGINYRAEIWVNGNLVGNMAGMFRPDYIDITDFAKTGATNALAIKVYPIDIPGGTKTKSWGAANGEYRNGGDGNIGLNVTMLMSAGWDFTFNDGIRDRNTGIWKDVQIFTTGDVTLRYPFVKSQLSHPFFDKARETVSVEVHNPMHGTVKCTVKGEITGENIRFSKDVALFGGETRNVIFTPDEFPQLVVNNPRLWWPRNKGKQELYELKLTAEVNGQSSQEIKSRFGIREIISNQDTPDHSRQFYVNGKKLFIRGANWIPEAMLRTSEERTYAEIRYAYQSGVNMIRMWGGGIADSDYLFQLCDEMGLLVWQEFWMTGDTKHPNDPDLYLSNVQATMKRLRNHPSLAYYVCSNENTEISGIKELINQLDGTRGYQMQSECDGIHDGSPYKTVNPMQYYYDSASSRGSRIWGFNPEYGFSNIPTVECMREMMDQKDLWPINVETWKYHEGGGFYSMEKTYKNLVDQYGKSKSIEDFCKKGQLVNAMQATTMWEVWNYNKLNYGDRYTSGVLFWYFNSPMRQVSSHLWDWSLEPNSSLYYTQHALEPLHPQFNYAKNTVSVINDLYQPFQSLKVVAEVYDMSGNKIWSHTSNSFNLLEDGVVNDLFKIDFPSSTTQVHYIKLRLLNQQGRMLGSSFYLRSKDDYKGENTVTGPTTSGFQKLENLPGINLKIRIKDYENNNRRYVDITVKNPTKTVALFTQLQLLDREGRPVRPSFYSDNFFSLLPRESIHVIIDTALKDIQGGNKLVVKGWNVGEQFYDVK